MKKKVYEGFLSQDDFEFLSISKSENSTTHPLAALISNDWKNGDQVFLRYYITNKKITPDEVQEKHLSKILGNLTVDYELEAYSEWTVLDWKEKLSVGSHNLIDELKSYEGKYLVLIIEEPSHE